MKKFCKRFLQMFFCALILGVATGGAHFYFFDSTIKGNYYFKIASDLDESSLNGSGEALKYYKKALRSYENSGNVSGAVETYINLGLLHYKFGNMLQVESMVLKALAKGQDNIPIPMQARVYLLLASTLEPDKAIKYFEQSLAISKQHHLHALTAEAYFLQGKSNEYQAKFEEAEQNYLSAIAAVENISSIDQSFKIDEVYDRLGELYAGGGEIDKAIAYYSKALDYNLQNERGFVTANYMKILGDLYEEKRNYVKACEMWGQSKDEYAFFGAVAPFEISHAYKVYRPCEDIS